VPIDGWRVVDTFGDRISAEALLGLFASENLPSRIDSNEVVPGLGTEFSVLVPAELLHRANWIRRQAGDVSAQELIYLATGELPNGSSESK
jgi:hypothetical protein